MSQQTIFTLEKLYQAYLDCRRTKRKTINALKFEWNLEKNLFKLQKELETKIYRPGRSICFVVQEPSPREIFAASFRDRIVHHLLINEIENAGEKEFIFDTYSCRKKKGTHLAIKRLREFIRKVTENNTSEAFYLQLDISGFFMAIDQNILYSLFKKLSLRQGKSLTWEEDILWLAKIIIFHKPVENYIIKGNLALFKLIPPRKSLFYAQPNKGLPIGNYSSQFFANLYLNELDQFVKRDLICSQREQAHLRGERGCKYYVRYVDDFILLNKDIEKLKFVKEKIDLFLREKLLMELNLDKTKNQSINKGIDFLGYFVKPNHILIRRKVVIRLKNKLRIINSLNFYDTDTIKKIIAIINSYYGHFRHAYTFNLRKGIYEKYLDKLGCSFVPALNYSFLKMKKMKNRKTEKINIKFI
jgi:hypothetical protein